MTLKTALEQAADHISTCGKFSRKIDQYKIRSYPEDRIIRKDCQDNATTMSWQTVGTNMIQQGKVAVIMMAGGDGTRLGHIGPKGTYTLDLSPKRSIFNIVISRITEISPTVPLYIMTNKATHASIEGHFKQNNYFGMDPESVSFIQQGSAPCLNSDRSNPIMRAPGIMAEAPNGNGGLHLLLRKLRLVDEFHRKGVKYVSVIPVDNVLALPADPFSIGLAESMNLDILTKVLDRLPNEKVGVATIRNERPTVVEYINLPEDMNDVSTFGYGVAGLHLFSVRFLRRVTKPEVLEALPVHYANKKIPQWDEERQRTVEPKQPNGWKQEYFIFDVFPAVEPDRFACQLISRDEEFAVIKNRVGSDSPVSALIALRKQGYM